MFLADKKFSFQPCRVSKSYKAFATFGHAASTSLGNSEGPVYVWLLHGAFAIQFYVKKLGSGMVECPGWD